MRSQRRFDGLEVIWEMVFVHIVHQPLIRTADPIPN
jgi:hypothetical protein